jgi:metal-responsive CopG/Arc/MetJ family transcriptional regulator
MATVMLRTVKTVVSIPDELFETAERAAERLGVSRSELYTRAVARLLHELRAHDVTQRLDEVYAAEPAMLDPSLVIAQAASIEAERW